MSESKIGKVVQVIGPVVDIKFDEASLPNIYNEIKIDMGDIYDESDSDDEITEDEDDDIEMSEEDNYEDDSYDKDIDDDDLVDDDYSDLSIVDEDELDNDN